jgi:hypothetical protein
MKRIAITLLDPDTREPREYWLNTPSQYAFDLMTDDHVYFVNVTPEQKVVQEAMPTDRWLAIVLAAMLTDCEPHQRGIPDRVWTYQEVLRIWPMERDSTANIDAAVRDLVADALHALLPSERKGTPAPPTKGRARGSAKR